MPRSFETPSSGRALLVTGLRRCDGITRGCPYQATSQHHGKEQQTSIEAPAARHSGAGRNPETTPAIATPAQTGTPRPKPHQALHWVPACAGYPNMRPRLAANARRPINRRTGYRPAPVRRSPTRALFPTPIAPQARRTANAPASPRRPSFRRRPESRNHARHRNTRPNRHPASEAPPDAALGTGLRRYDGLKRTCFIRRPCRPDR